MRKSKCRGIPSKPALLTEHGTLPAQKPGWRESPPEDSADKMTRETCPEKSSNGKEKRPRSRREKNSAPRFFRPSPEIKIPSPEKRIPGLGISRSGSEISRQTVQKVNFSNKILHKNPVLCKKIAQKSAIWAGLRKSRVTETIQNGTICLFSQAFHDILIARPEAKPLCLVGEMARKAGGVSHPRIVPQRKQKGCYDPARETKRPLWPPHGEQKGWSRAEFVKSPLNFDCPKNRPIRTATRSAELVFGRLSKQTDG